MKGSIIDLEKEILDKEERIWYWEHHHKMPAVTKIKNNGVVR
jgi:hypothetical protein